MMVAHGSGNTSLRDTLRALPVFAVELPGFEPDQAPGSPVALFADWLHAAVAGDVAEPHVAVLSTVNAHGAPSARALICKDVQDPGNWFFASSSYSRKGQEIAVNPAVALTFYWPTQGRQVRVEGHACSAGEQASAHDFLARPAESRIEALIDRQSQLVEDPSQIDEASAEARSRLEGAPDLVAPNWTLYSITALQAEFWQADRQRRHIRLRYRRADEFQPWARERLCP